jgi:hypothetical protein
MDIAPRKVADQQACGKMHHQSFMLKSKLQQSTVWTLTPVPGQRSRGLQFEASPG